MRKLDRYIRNTVFLAMLTVLLVVASLDFIFSVFEEISDTNDAYQAWDAMQYVLLTFPRHIYDLLPMAALIGALIGLGIMASSNELVVMQAAGIKVKRIVWAVMKPTGVVMLLGLLLGEFVAPPLELKGELNKDLASGKELVISGEGFWQKDDNEYMHFNAIADNVLHGVSIYKYEGQTLLSNTFAETALYQENTDESFWVLQNGNKTVFSSSEESANTGTGTGTGTTSLRASFESSKWEVSLTPELLKVLIIDSDKMAISDLYQYAKRLESQGQDASPYLLSFWEKTLQPLTTAMLVLVAISFIFGPLREATMGSRVSSAIAFALGFTLFQNLLKTVSLLYQFNPFLAVAVPIVIIGLIGLLMLRRAT